MRYALIFDGVDREWSKPVERKFVITWDKKNGRIVIYSGSKTTLDYAGYPKDLGTNKEGLRNISIACVDNNGKECTVIYSIKKMNVMLFTLFYEGTAFSYTCRLISMGN